MASPLTERTLKSITSDPETGCVGMSADPAFQLCKQNYFLKEQNQILQNQGQNPRNQDSQIQTENTINKVPVNQMTLENSSGVSIPILIVVVFLGAILIQKLIKNEKH